MGHLVRPLKQVHHLNINIYVLMTIHLKYAYEESFI